MREISCENANIKETRPLQDYNNCNLLNVMTDITDGFYYLILREGFGVITY